MESVLLFLLLNFLLFLPRFFLNKKTSHFLPYKEIFTERGIRLEPLLSRFNDDIFRVNLELAFLCLVLVFVKSFLAIQVSQFIFFVFYLVTLFTFYYHYSIYSIYKTFPAISVDYPLIKEGFDIAKKGYLLTLVLGLIGFLGFIIGTFFISHYFIATLYSNNSIALTLACFTILFLAFLFCIYKKVNFLRYSNDADFHYLTFAVVQSTILILSSNKFYNKKSKSDLLKIPKIIEQSCFEFPKDVHLVQKPNVFFIAVESYGAILYENEIFKSDFEKICETLSNELQSNHIYIASSLSKAAVTGGASWVSYSSFLKGINIDNNSIYRYLFNNQSKHKAESIFEFFEKQDYDSYLLSGLGGFENYTIEWDNILRFLGSKNVVKFKDLEYQGRLFNFGPSSPDQYLLHKTMEIMKTRSGNKPITSFVETINSHYPFVSPTKILDDWKKCATTSEKDFNITTKLSSNVYKNYFQAIEYQLKSVLDLITKNNENSIFVIFGDHQPPIITNHQNSYNTPIHIVSKNKSFIEDWHRRGFSKTLYLNNHNNDLHHYEVKNIFLEIFLKNYS